MFHSELQFRIIGGMLSGRQGAAAGCALYALRGRAASGGKVPLPGAHANAPTGGVRAASTGKASVGLHNHLHYI